MRAYLKSIWNRKRLERDMHEELGFHIQSFADDLAAAGMPPAEALRQARLRFGAVEAHKEDCRASLGLRLWDELSGDLRNGLRVLRQSPVFTAVAVTSLALGIGANTAIFTLANEFLFKTLPVPHTEMLRRLSWVQTGSGHMGPVWGTFAKNDQGQSTGSAFPYPLYREMQSHQDVMDNLAGFKDVQRLTATIAGEAEAVDGLLVSGNFYQCLGARVEAGRAITPADDSPSAAGVVVISDAFWDRRFGRSADILGKTIHLNRLPLTIIGVNAPEFKGVKLSETPEVFFPLSLQPSVIPNNQGAILSKGDFWWVVVIGRLRPGITDQAATAALTQDYNHAFSLSLPKKKEIDRPRFVLEDGARGLDLGSRHLRSPIYLLLGVAGLVLLIACANLANLLMVRATVRQREIGLRLALGAGRIRILRQLLTESLLLAFLGGSVGLLLGYLARNIIPNLFDHSRQTARLDSQLDWRVFLFAFAITLATGLLFGIAPAWRATRSDANAALKETGRMTTSRTKARFGKALVVFQVALSLLLVVTAGLFLRTLLNLRSAPTGLHTEHITLFELNPPRSHYSLPQRIALFQQIDQQLAVIPGIESATSSSNPLLADDSDTDCYHPSGRDSQDIAMTNYVGTNFFSTFGIPVLAGRALNQSDTLHAPKVAVINQQMARVFSLSGNPIGQTIRACGDPKAEPIQIVGLSADAKYDDLRRQPPPSIYFPYPQAEDLDSMTFEVKSAASVQSILPKLRATVRAIDKDLPLLKARTQTEQIDDKLTMERLFAALTSGFGMLALLLASIGIYGVMAYTVALRTNEIGIRMALGAESRQVLAMVLGETSIVTILGILTGLAGAFAATRLIATMLFGVKPNDPSTLIGGAGLLFAVATLAASVPAWRAARVDPLNALRHE